MTANLIFALAGFFFGVTAALCVAFLASYALRLRRELKAAQKALEARDAAPDDGSWKGLPPERIKEMVANSVADMKRRHANDDDPRTHKEEPRFSGIGPTDIANREMYERQQEAKASTPVFASPSVLNPSLGEIQQAAREATNGGKPK